MGKKVKRGSTENKPKKKDSGKKVSAVPAAGESLEKLIQQKEEIQALLSSLEDAYSEATILEDDYNEIKSKNTKRLEEIEKKIETLKSKEAGTPAKGPSPAPPEPRAALKPSREAPPEEIPAAIPSEPETAPPIVVEEKPKKESPKKTKAKEEKEHVSPDDLKNLELELADKVKEMVEEIGTKLNEKDVLEIKNNFAKSETEIEKMKALVESIKESRKISDEKIQRVVEGLAEIRTMVYGREASTKEQEIKFEKVMDIMNKLEPEKLMMELSKRDKEMSDQKLRMDKLEETTKEFGEMFKRIEKLLKDIGSLENVVKVSNEASEKLMSMQNIETSNRKMLDKIQGIYAELSKRMEEFMLYKAKQSRIEDLVNELLKNLDSVNTKMDFFVTKEDMESFKASVQASAAPAEATPGVSSEEKEEVEMLMKSLEEEFKSGVISKEDYEKMKNANLEKLKNMESVKAEGAPVPAAPAPPAKEEKGEGGKGKKEVEPAKEEKPERTKESGEREDMLLKDLEETFKKGFISKKAYEKTRKMILGKGE